MPSLCRTPALPAARPPTAPHSRAASTAATPPSRARTSTSFSQESQATAPRPPPFSGPAPPPRPAATPWRQTPATPLPPEASTSPPTPAAIFNLTGAYKCVIGQPVYIYAYGGNIGTSSNTPVTFTITSASFTEDGNSGRYTVTFNATNTLSAGATVTFAGLKNGYAQLNGTTQTVIAPVSATSFTMFFTGGHGSLNGTTTGTATYTPPATATENNSVVQLATLGNCPSSGNFSTAGNGALSYVFLNEVSTVATAYTFQPFTLATNNDAWHIGSSGTTQALLGIANAANTAAQLYNIQGSGPQSTANDGEGHLANATTVTANGTVPQATIDTLANILANCVDSVPISVGSTTTECGALFSVATDNGETTGTNPTDTGTAAINIARYPAGNNSAGTVDATYAADLYDLQTGTVPYVPALTAAPKDFSLAISYPSTLNANMGNPESIAIDSKGNVVFSNQSTGYITGFLPTGALSYNYASTGTPGYVSIDPSNNVWFGSIGSNKIVELSASGNSYTTSTSSFSTVSAAATDSSGNFYFIAAVGNAADVYEYTSSFGSPGYSPFTGSAACIASGITYDHLAIDSAQTLWVADEHGGAVCRFTTNGAVYSNKFPVATGAYPEAISIDHTGNVWVSLEDANDVAHITLNGGTPTLATLTSASTGATFSEPFSTAVDGASSIWVTNRTNNTIAELTNAGQAISPSVNYQSGTNILNDPLNAAVDPSGNVWITNYGGQKVVELVGAAAPTVTPLSLASGNGGLGNKP